MTLQVAEFEEVVCAYAEKASFPGGENLLVYVIIRTPRGLLRQVCLCPEDQTERMKILFHVAEAVNREMTNSARAMCEVVTR